jgi:hypothetical protein
MSAQYKEIAQRAMHHCVYVTIHPFTGKFYIGKGTTSKVVSGAYKGSGKKLNMAFQKHPKIEWFSVVIQTFATAVEAYAAEKVLVNEKTLSNVLCQNLIPGGSGSYTTKSHQGNLGKKHSDETKAKISANHRRNQSDLAKMKVSIALAGIPKSTEHKLKNSLAHTGKTASAATKAKMSATRKRLSALKTSTLTS